MLLMCNFTVDCRWLWMMSTLALSFAHHLYCTLDIPLAFDEVDLTPVPLALDDEQLALSYAVCADCRPHCRTLHPGHTAGLG